MPPTLPSVAIMALAGLACATVITDDAAVVASKTFDFVIVGAGLSGITVGNKARYALPHATLTTAIRCQHLLSPSSAAAAIPS